MFTLAATQGNAANPLSRIAINYDTVDQRIAEKHQVQNTCPDFPSVVENQGPRSRLHDESAQSRKVETAQFLKVEVRLGFRT
jgi:hypothetical protein